MIGGFHQSCKLLLAWHCAFLSLPPVFCKELDPATLIRSFGSNDASPVEELNKFSVSNFSQTERKKVTFDQAMLVVQLLTPLNSSFNKEGDSVEAEVTESKLENGKEWLPRGTIVKGTVERVHNATYGKTDGNLVLRFYEARYHGQVFDLNSEPDTKDSSLRPERKKVTKKAIARRVLTSASFIAIPLAVGTFGTSLAITTGAGAVIGAVLADDGKHVRGAIEGAMDGSGLGVLKPIIEKGQVVILPVGSRLELRLREPIQVPAAIVKLAMDLQRHRSEPAADTLATSARILSSKDADVSGLVEKCQKLLDQNDLAGALSLMDDALNSAPDNQTLKQIKQHLIDEATGGSAPPTHDMREAGDMRNQSANL